MLCLCFPTVTLNRWELVYQMLADSRESQLLGTFSVLRPI